MLIDYSVPNQYEIGEFRFETQGHLSHDYLRQRSGLYQGQEITIPGDDIAEAIKRLWETGHFSSVDCYIEKMINKYVFLLFKLEERPTLCRYGFPGLKKSEREDLKGKLKLSKGQSVTSHDEQRIHNAIAKYYTEKGHLFASADLVLKPDEDSCGPNTMRLDIVVNRGSKVKINDIIISGNDDVDEGTLQRKMKETKEKSMINFPAFSLRPQDTTKRFNPIYTLGNISFKNISNWTSDKFRLRVFKWSKFLDDKYKQDKLAIIKYYNSLGYRDATIVADSIVRLDGENINIYLSIDEGHQYYFRNIAWDGNTKFTAQDLDRVLDIRKGDIYDQSLLERKLYFDITSGDISSLYMDRGHLFFNIRTEETLIPEDSIDLMIHIYEGPQAVIDQVIISGNTKTSEHVIRRELRTLPGEYFSRADLIRSQREIAALNLFDPEQLGINPIPNPADGTVDIEFSVVEKSSDQIELSAGWGGAVSGLFGTAGIVFNNFAIRNVFKPERWNPLPAGDGQQLSMRLQSNGLYFQSYTLSFVEPWLGGKKPNSLGVSSNYTLLNRAGRARTDETASFIITRSVSLSYGKRLTWPDELFALTSAINFQNYYLRDYPGFVISNGNANNFHLKETFQRRPTFDNPQFPSEGSSMWLSLQLTPPYSLLNPGILDKPDSERYKWIEYHKWRFNADWYTRIAGSTEPNRRKLVLKTSAKLGFVGYYNKDLGLSGFELFQLGGDGLTGFGAYTLVGYDIISLRGTDAAFAPVGSRGADPSASIFNKYTVELRYPFSLSAATTIFALVFAEGGNAYNGFENFDPFLLRRSVGIGLRVYLPMFGLLGFDYGIGFDNPESRGLKFGERLGRGEFHFKIGFEPE